MEPRTINALSQDFPRSGEYARALSALRPELNDGQVRCLRAHYLAPGRTATARRLAEAVGYADYRGVNLQYGKLAVRLCETLGVCVDGDAVYILGWFAWDADHEAGECQFVMRPQLAVAVAAMGWHQDADPSAAADGGGT